MRLDPEIPVCLGVLGGGGAGELFEGAAEMVKAVKAAGFGNGGDSHVAVAQQGREPLF